MAKNTLLSVLLCWLIAGSLQAQHVLLSSLDSLLVSIRAGKLNSAYVSLENGELSQEVFKDDQAVVNLKLKVINTYPLGNGQFWVELSCTDSSGALKNILSFVGRAGDAHITFAIPLAYLTRDWQTEKIGRVTYHFVSGLDRAVARGFDGKNETIAKKLGLVPENFDFYLTDNYQQVLALLGTNYDAGSTGRVREGGGPSFGTIFAVMHNADFSHDLTHYYVAKIRTGVRNPIPEEGLAYYWGNAYYTNADGQMIDYPDQLRALKEYIQQYPDSSLLSVFEHNDKIFPQFGPEVSGRSVISALLCAHIEATRGVEGIKELMNCGKGEDNYFIALGKLTGIGKGNFEDKVRGLLGQ